MHEIISQDGRRKKNINLGSSFELGREAVENCNTATGHLGKLSQIECVQFQLNLTDNQTAYRYIVITIR